MIVHTISEHVENAGVHSGDATLLLPPQTIEQQALDTIRQVTFKMALALNITGQRRMLRSKWRVGGGSEALVARAWSPTPAS